MFQSRILSAEDIFRYRVIIEHAKLFKRTFVIFSDTYDCKTRNVGNHMNIASIVKLLGKSENVLMLHHHYKKFNTLLHTEFSVLNKIPNVVFIAECTTEPSNFVSKLNNNYQAFLSGYSDKVNYSKCSLKCFRFQRFEGILMPDITVIMNKELKQFANGFDKDIEIDYDQNRIRINGKEIDRKPWDCEDIRDKLLLLGSANHLKTNSLHCALLSLMIGVPKVTLTHRNWTSKVNQLKNWLKEIGFKVEGDTIYNYEHDWDNEAKIVYEAFDKYIRKPQTIIEETTVQKILDDKHVHGRVVGLNYNSLINPNIYNHFLKIEPYGHLDNNTLTVSAGLSSKELVKYSNCFFGLETIPGTVGGMIYNNASCVTCISDHIVDVLYGSCRKYGDELQFKRIAKNECEFGKRTSIFRKLVENGFQVVILEATFKIPDNYNLSSNQLKEHDIKLSQMEIFKDCKYKPLQDNSPIGAKGCVYCDHLMNVMLRETHQTGLVKHNIKIDERWPVYWVPLKDATYDDWINLINECNQQYKLRYHKSPYMEIEIL